MRTGQFVEAEHELFQCRAEAEFRRNVACAARRSFLDVGTLVYQTGQDEHKIDVPVSRLLPRERNCIALQRPTSSSSVGIRPAIQLIERIINNQPNVYSFPKQGKMSTK